MIPQAWLWMFSVQQLEQGSIDTSFVSAASPWLDDSNCTKMELCIPNSLAFFSGSCHSHRHCRLLRQGDATKQFLLRLCLSFLSVSHACLGVGANFEVRFNLDPFGKKSDEDLETTCANSKKGPERCSQICAACCNCRSFGRPLMSLQQVLQVSPKLIPFDHLWFRYVSLHCAVHCHCPVLL